MSENEIKAIEILKNTRQAWAKIVYRCLEKQQKEIEALEIIHNTYKEMIEENNYISKDKIRERIKELEEQQETLKYDGNVCFADYEQFCKNLNFLKEQIKELLEEK